MNSHASGIFPARPALLLCLLLSSLSAVASDIYGFVDGEGVAHYSNVPDSGRYQLVLRNREDYVAKTDDRYRLRGSGKVSAPTELPYSELITRESSSLKLDPSLVHAVVYAESRYNPLAVSPKGAVGLMQLLPETAKRYQIEDLKRPEDNIRAGTRYLSDLLTLFDGNVSLALAAYNAGENAVIRHGNRIPPYAETRDYVPRVLRRYEEIKAALAKPGRPRV